jgi:phage terminase large subunit-like protein
MTRAERVIAFIHTYCRVPDGKMVGQPMRLQPFQERFVREVYDNPAGTRLGILSIARKNGKSGLIAAIMLAHLVGPEARLNSQIVSGARSRKQAAVVYNLASKMVFLNPDLKKIIRPIPSAKTLIGLTMNTTYEALAAEAGTAHGLSPVLAIIDEMGQVKGEQDAFIEAIETGQGAYDDALELVISTQAPTDADMLSIRIDDAERSGDPTIVCHVYQAPKEAELLDRSAWEAANPALGSFRSLAELERKAVEAERMPSAENGFRNLYLNQRVMRFNPFITPSVWKENGGEVDDDVFRSGPVWGGLDLSKVTDLTAFVLVAERDGIWHVKPTFWTPEATLRERSQRDKQAYDAWVGEGLLLATPGPAVDYSFVARDMAAITRGMDIRKIGFDPWKFDQLKPHLANEGMPEDLFELMIQGPKTMSPALAATETEFLHRRVRTGLFVEALDRVAPHPVLTMCAAHAVTISDSNENRKLDKAKSTGRIDGMVALCMAMGLAMASQGAAPEYQMLII